MIHKLKINLPCGDCSGTGVRTGLDGTNASTCPACKGSKVQFFAVVDASEIFKKLDSIIALLPKKEKP
jgi:DnaJ-class molecular chaperone